MEIADAVFSLTIILLSAWIAYQWVIRPEREERQRKSEQLLAEMRRHRGKRLKKTAERQDKPVSAKSSASLSRQNQI